MESLKRLFKTSSIIAWTFALGILATPLKSESNIIGTCFWVPCALLPEKNLQLPHSQTEEIRQQIYSITYSNPKELLSKEYFDLKNEINTLYENSFCVTTQTSLNCPNKEEINKIIERSKFSALKLGSSYVNWAISSKELKLLRGKLLEINKFYPFTDNTLWLKDDREIITYIQSMARSKGACYVISSFQTFKTHKIKVLWIKSNYFILEFNGRSVGNLPTNDKDNGKTCEVNGQTLFISKNNQVSHYLETPSFIFSPSKFTNELKNKFHKTEFQSSIIDIIYPLLETETTYNYSKENMKESFAFSLINWNKPENQISLNKHHRSKRHIFIQINDTSQEVHIHVLYLDDEWNDKYTLLTYSKEQLSGQLWALIR